MITKVFIDQQTRNVELREVASPAVSAGHARVKVLWAGVNYIDLYHKSGLYPLASEAGLGMEGCGEIIEANGALKVGTKVAWYNVAGSYATEIVASEKDLLPLPAGSDPKIAAALAIQGIAAHYLCNQTVALSQGDKVLVHAAAGGVGRLLVQLCKQKKVFVFATAGGEQKCAEAARLGADVVIDYTRDCFVDLVRSSSGMDRPCSVVFDSVGQATFEKGLQLLAPRKTMVLFGQSSGAVEPFNPALLAANGSLFLTRPSLFHYYPAAADASDVFSQLIRSHADAKLQVALDSQFALEHVDSALKKLSSRKSSGKILIDCNG